jgi:iron(III) transport system substrate-binding protein
MAGLILSAAALFGAAPQQAAAQGVSAAEWEKILAAAKKEGKVVLYTATVAPVMQRIAADFAKVHPDITLEWFRYPSGPLMAKVDQERLSGAPSADVVSSTEALWFEDRAKEGNLIRAVGPDAAKFPAKYQLGAGNTAAILSLDALTIMVITFLFLYQVVC